MRRVSPAMLAIYALLSVLLFMPGQVSAQKQQDGRGGDLRPVSKLPSKEKRWALIIGIDEYEKDVSSLKGAANDARALKDVLVNYAGFPEDHVILLTSDAANANDRPKRENILDAFNSLNGQVQEDGLLLFSFSGHGVSVGDRAYLIPSNGRITKNLSLLRDYSIDVERIKEAVKDMKVRQVLMLLDACRNEPGRGGTANLLTEPYTRGFSFDVANSGVKAFATLYATSIGERAFEFFDRGTQRYRGYFSYAIEEGMKGNAANEKGEVTLNGLIKYVENTVPKRVRVEKGESQEPSNEVAGFKQSELILSIARARVEPTATSKPSNNTPSSNSSTVDRDSALQEESFNFETNKRFTIGKGKYEFITSWSSCNDACIYSISDYMAGVANSKATDFDDINDFTAYDMSSRVRQAKLNEILVLKNKAGYYALVQIKKISYDRNNEANNLLTIRYKIIPEKLQSKWKPTPEKYISRSKSGRVTFDFSDNDGKFIIGEGEFEFITSWGGRGFRKVYLLGDYVKSLAVVKDASLIRNPSDARRFPKVDRVADLTVGNRAVLENSNGRFAVVKIISAKTEGHASDVDEVMFEYEILPQTDVDNSPLTSVSNAEQKTSSALPSKGKKSLRVLYSDGVVTGKGKLLSTEVFPFLNDFSAPVKTALEKEGLKISTLSELNEQDRHQYFGAINSRYQDSNALKSFQFALFVNPALTLEDLENNEQGSFVALATGYIQIINTENGKTILYENIAPTRGYGKTKALARSNALRAAALNIPDSFIKAIAENAR